VVEARLPEGARCLVVEDSAHTSATTRGALEGFARFVPVGGFFVVEDGCVDHEDLRPDADWPRGVLPAVRAWLETEEGRGFTVRRDLELYGITAHPEGFLQRVTP
jgi:cephalosporin hydroxylase